eukprot:3116970-Prymnesium_polylepis.1
MLRARTSSDAQSIPQRSVLERLGGGRIVLPPGPLGRCPMQPLCKQRLLEGQVAELVDGRRGGRLLLERLKERPGSVCCSQLLPDRHALGVQSCNHIFRGELTLHALGCQHVGGRDPLHHLQRRRGGACVSLACRYAQCAAHGRRVELHQ